MYNEPPVVFLAKVRRSQFQQQKISNYKAISQKLLNLHFTTGDRPYAIKSASFSKTFLHLYLQHENCFLYKTNTELDDRLCRAITAVGFQCSKNYQIETFKVCL